MAKLLVAANELEMMNGEYAFITLDFTVESNWVNKSWAGGRSMEDFVALFDGTVNLSVKGPHGERYETFVRQFSETIKANNISETSIVSIVLSSKSFFCKIDKLHRILKDSCNTYWKMLPFVLTCF